MSVTIGDRVIVGPDINRAQREGARGRVIAVEMQTILHSGIPARGTDRTTYEVQTVQLDNDPRWVTTGGIDMTIENGAPRRIYRDMAFLISDDPKVGMGCTISLWTDRHAGTVERISKGGKVVWIRQDDAKRTDTNGMSESQSYEFSPNPNGRLWKVSLRKNGSWQGVRGSCRVFFGRRGSYHDFSF